MASVNGYGQAGVGGVFGIGLFGASWGTGSQVDVSTSDNGSTSYARGDASEFQLTFAGVAFQFVFEQQSGATGAPAGLCAD
jgi:hypothetical protein